MIILTILLTLFVIGAIVLSAISAGFIVVFGDAIIAAVVLCLIYKLITGKKSKKR